MHFFAFQLLLYAGSAPLYFIFLGFPGCECELQILLEALQYIDSLVVIEQQCDVLILFQRFQLIVFEAEKGL
jgi:hypothetical protein